MILHCDDGIRHMEAVLKEPTNLTEIIKAPKVNVYQNSYTAVVYLKSATAKSPGTVLVLVLKITVLVSVLALTVLVPSPPVSPAVLNIITR